MPWTQLSRLSESKDSFLCKSFLGLSLVSLVVMMPLGINNFINARYLLALGSLLISCLFGFNTWFILARGRYYPSLTLFGLTPAILFFLSLSIRSQGLIGIFWSYPSTVSFYFMLPEKKAWIANSILLLIVLPLAWQVLEFEVAVRLIITLVMISVFSAIFIRVINEQQYSLKTQATTDPLTGLLNRMLLSETLEQACAQSQRTNIPMTLASFDIDHFKKINDTFGHDSGDRVLQGLGELICARVRRTDRAFRLGGEEFLLLLYGTQAQEGWMVAEELRASIAAYPLLPGKSITVSVGLATLEPTETWQSWMKRSDDNLYRAKNGGRNRVAG